MAASETPALRGSRGFIPSVGDVTVSALACLASSELEHAGVVGVVEEVVDGVET